MRKTSFALLFLLLVSVCGSVGLAPMAAGAQGVADEYLVPQGSNLRFAGTIAGKLS